MHGKFDLTEPLNTSTPPGRKSKVIFPVPDHLTQAFRRLALRGNSHWVSYYSAEKIPGKNDKQASKGHITNKGRDTRKDAAKPYWYTQAVVDQRKLGFGFWSRSDQGQASTYGFACYDIEPINLENGKRVDREPTTAKCNETFVEAIRVYAAWKALARTNHEILWILLVESSADHYHVWAIFARPLTQAEHDGLVDEAATIHSTLTNLDKSSKRGKGRFGDQFRSPWSWKKGRRSEALASWVRDGDEEALVRLAEEARPANARGVTKTITTGRTKPKEHDPASLAEHAVEKFPIHGPGELNRVTGLMVADLVNRGVPEVILAEAGDSWLEHFDGVYETDLATAKQTLRRIILKTFDNPKFRNAGPADYESYITDRILTPQQKETLSARPASRARGKISSSAGSQESIQQQAEAGCSPYQRGKGEQPGFLGLASLLRGEFNSYVLEAITILCEVELAKRDAKTWTVSFTHQQVFDAIAWRHPDFWPAEMDEAGCRVRDVTFRRFKQQFASYALAPRKAGDPAWHDAKGLELLRELKKGTPGLASRYEVVGPLRHVLVAGGLVGEDGLGRTASFEARPETPVVRTPPRPDRLDRGLVGAREHPSPHAA